jgi:hypothetical protein
MHSLFLLSYIVTLVRDATVVITGLIGNRSTCKLVYVWDHIFNKVGIQNPSNPT